MNRWTVLFVATIISLFVAIGCSGNGGGSPVAPAAGPDVTSGPNLTTGQADSKTFTSMLGYYVCTIDAETQTLEVREDRTAMYIVNLIPFLNQMSSPQYGLTFGFVEIDETDPDVLKANVEFQWHHPFPLIEQYKLYDFMGAIVTNGDSSINYDGLWVNNYGTDTYMTNADCYTRWMNPTEFTTELIFGWAPGGIQNLEGNAMLNPAKCYGQGLGPEDDLWDWLTGGSVGDGYFESGMGRMMNLEFPSPEDGLVFGYLALACWEEQYEGPYTPYHRDEPIACKLEVTESLWYDGAASGGNLNADISLWSWEELPSVVKVESTVLAGSVDATGPTPGGANVSVWHVDVASAPFTGTEGHEVWVIAECSAFGYYPVTELGEVLDIPSSDGALAAFFRIPLEISPEQFNTCPTIVSGVDGLIDPHTTETATYNVVATDVEGDPLLYDWVVTDVLTGMPIGVYNGVPGDGAGNLDVDFSLFSIAGDSYDIDCGVSDPLCTTDAATLTVTVTCNTVFVDVLPPYGQMDDPASLHLIELEACEDGVGFYAALDNGVDPLIVADPYTYVDDTHFEAEFDLGGAALGVYSLTVVNGCGGDSDTGIDVFEIKNAGPVLKDNGDLPTPRPTSLDSLVDFGVTGNNGFGNAGVYYHYSTGANNYLIYYFPLDYSAGGAQYGTGPIYSPYIQPGNQDGLFGGAQWMHHIEVTPNGSVFWTTKFTGPMIWGNLPGHHPVWWSSSTDFPNITNGYLYYNMEFHDLEMAFSATGTMWGYWGNDPAGVDGATFYCTSPYQNYYSITGYYPADHTGSVDGMVSDNEAYRCGIDTDPEGISAPYNMIWYYMEGAPDDDGIEVFQNISNMAFPTSICTIDSADSEWTGTPVDVSVAPTFGNSGSALSNWVCLLEDNGDSTWNLSCWDQNGIFIGRAGSYDGDAIGLDVDIENNEVHIWAFDSGGDIDWFIFELL